MANAQLNDIPLGMATPSRESGALDSEDHRVIDENVSFTAVAVETDKVVESLGSSHKARRNISSRQDDEMSLVDGTEEDVRQSWSDLDIKKPKRKRDDSVPSRKESSEDNEAFDPEPSLSKDKKEKVPSHVTKYIEKYALKATHSRCYGSLSRLWSEAHRIKKDNQGMDPSDVIQLTQRAIVLAAGAHKQPAVCGGQTSSPSTSFREETLAGKPVTEQTGEQLWSAPESAPEPDPEPNPDSTSEQPSVQETCKPIERVGQEKTFKESGFDKQRNNRTFEQEGHNTVFPNKGFVHKQHFSGTKEGRGSKTCYKSKRPKCFFTLRTFQNGGNSFVKRSSFEERLDVKIDLTDAYLTLQIAKNTENTSDFLAGKNNGIQVLPFGIAVAPRIFTKLMKVPMTLLRRLGVRLIVYLDDILIMNQSNQKILSDLSTVLSILRGLGFLINTNKSVMEPSQTMEFLGYTVNSKLLTLSLPKEKVEKIKNSSKLMLEHKKVSARDLAQLIGQLTATNQAVLPGPLH
ncbi:Hypothetical predicted protein [Mytilus galloprovincialis]|uniref:Reverse transcriptase domain-containing protein n=1 Tax=Mytilus galloprovincialis TaxID=29158 RepID=A0A8B6H5A6_MYTGA|nr:Hypothetical predicted protein [Mytilus galloprovincialis]